LEDRADRGVQYLANNVDTFLAAARDGVELARVTTTLLPNVPRCTSKSIGIRRSNRVSRCRMFIILCKLSLEDHLLTISIDSAGNGRSMFRPDEEFRENAEQIGQFYVPEYHNNQSRSLP